MRASVLGVAINLDRLYSDPDPAYQVWCRGVVNEVEAVKSEMNQDA